MKAKLLLPILVSRALTAHLPATAAESVPATNSTAAHSTAPGVTLPRSDAKGNPLRRAPTGHVSNYDESKVGSISRYRLGACLRFDRPCLSQ